MTNINSNVKLTLTLHISLELTVVTGLIQCVLILSECS